MIVAIYRNRFSWNIIRKIYSFTQHENIWIFECQTFQLFGYTSSLLAFTRLSTLLLGSSLDCKLWSLFIEMFSKLESLNFRLWSTYFKVLMPWCMTHASRPIIANIPAGIYHLKKIWHNLITSIHLVKRQISKAKIIYSIKQYWWHNLKIRFMFVTKMNVTLSPDISYFEL